MIGAFLKRGVKRAAGSAFMTLLDSLNIYKGSRIILTYHRVVKEPDEGLCDPAILVTPETLEMHLAEISKRFKILPLEEFVGHPGGGRLCAITFDDGWRDNYEFAFPLLANYGIPATIFVSTGMIGSDKTFWFQRVWEQAASAVRVSLIKEFIGYYGSLVPSWQAGDMSAQNVSALFFYLKAMPSEELETISLEAYSAIGIEANSVRETLTWDEVLEMSKSGISFGSHGHTHHILPQLESGMKRKEIFDSLKMLKEKGALVSPFFCYPNGDWDEESLALVKEAGYRGAVTTQPGNNLPDSDPFLLRRINMHEYISDLPSLFWFRVYQTMSGSPQS